MNLLSWALTVILVVFFAIVTVSQWMAMIQAGARKKSNPNASGYSMVPLLGGVSGAIGCALCPNSTIKDFWWVPLFLDPGCVLLFSAFFGFVCYNWVRSLFRRS